MKLRMTDIIIAVCSIKQLVNRHIATAIHRLALSRSLRPATLVELVFNQQSETSNTG